MSSTDVRTEQANRDLSVGKVDLKFEAVVIPVSDVDRAKAFYAQLGWRLDADFAFDNGFRVVQFTPPGSGCSVQFGANITSAAPGSAQGLYLIVSDIETARGGLAAGGVEVSEVFHPGTPGAQFQPDGAEGSGVRTVTGKRQLRLVCRLRRPGRKCLAAAGDHGPVARSHRLR